MKYLALIASVLCLVGSSLCAMQVNFADGLCKTPTNFKYRQLDVCALDFMHDDSYITTTCTSTEFTNSWECPKGCQKFCGTVESGPIGCLKISSVYSILRTCGPAPSVLYDKTWLVETRSASDNCTDSLLISGVISGQCFSTSFADSKLITCTPLSRTEILYKDCKVFTCNGCTEDAKHTQEDIGKCDKHHKTYLCWTS